MSEHQLWNELGNIYTNSGAFEQAIKAFDKSIEVEPDFGLAYSNKALAYMRMGESEKSIPIYQRSIELLGSFSDKASAWHRLGNSYQVMDDTENALLAFQRAVDLDLDNIVYRHDLAVATAERGYEANEKQAEAEVIDTVENVAQLDKAEIPEADLEIEEEDISTKTNLASWLEQAIEKLSNKAFDKKPASLEGMPMVFPEGVAPEDVVAEIMTVRAEGEAKKEAVSLPEVLDEAEVEIKAMDQVEPVEEVGAKLEVATRTEVADEVVANELTVEKVIENVEEVQEEDDKLEEPKVANENTCPVPPAIAKDLIPVLNTIGDEESDVNFDDLVDELSKEIDLVEDEKIDDDIKRAAMLILEDDDLEDGEFDDEDIKRAAMLILEDDGLEDEEFDGDIKRAATLVLEDDNFEDGELDTLEKDFEDDDDRILFELKKEEAAVPLSSAVEFFSSNDPKKNGNGNSKGKELNMSTAKVWGELGNVFYSVGIFEGALFAYEKAIKLDSGFGLALNNLALLHVRNGKYHQAIELCLKSIDLLEDNTSQAISWNNLGNIYRMLEEYGQAEQAYRKADELDTGNLAVENWTRYGLLNAQYA